MTPSNPDNSQPFIYRICDAAGVFHLVAPVNHNHSQSEVDGLVAALAAKANAIPAGSPSGAIVIVGTSGEILRSGKTITDLLNAISAKADKNELGDSESDTFVQIDNDTLRLSAQQKMVLGIVDPDDEFVEINNDNIQNLRRAIANPDSTPTANSDNLVTSGGVKAAIDALLTNRIPIHQVAAILPKTANYGSEYELLSWLGDGKMALVLQTARPVGVSIEATGVDDSPTGTWSGSTDISFDLEQGIRTVKNIYDLMDAQLQNDYPGEYIGIIVNWKISVFARDTVQADTACLINFYNPTSAE